MNNNNNDDDDVNNNNNYNNNNIKYRTCSNNTLYLFKVLEAAICCEEHGIFHRDIKPLNIIMNAADWSEAKLTDFGLSCALHSEPYQEFRGMRNPRRVT